MLFFDAETRRKRRAKADVIEAVSTGYAGMRSKKGFAHMQKQLEHLQQ